MSDNREEVRQALRTFILEELLPGEDSANLLDETPLMSGRVLDSLASLRIIEFIEQRFSVEVRPEEMTEEYLDTVNSMTDLVMSKL